MTNLIDKFCRFCLKNYQPDTYGALSPVCDCERNYEYIMSKLEQIE